MTRVTFDEVALIGRKSGKCRCGKRRTRTQKFWQTVNPFNRNDAGQVKTRDEILAELRGRIAEWQSEPITCAECEPTNK